MSSQFSRVRSLPVICRIDLAFGGTANPSTIEGFQPFVNTIMKDAQFEQAHFGRASVTFDEESDTTSAGISYKQSLVITFPASDGQRAERIQQIHKAKFIRIGLSNGFNILMGRNDFEQNSRIKVKSKLNASLGQVQFDTTSIVPSGFTPSADISGLPVYIPINLINED